MSPRVPGEGEHGSLSLFFVLCSVGFLALVGLVLDGGGHVLALERADAVAREAARASCEQVDEREVLHGVYQIDHGRAALAATAYLRLASGWKGSSPVTGYPPTFPTWDTCKVIVTTRYQTKLLGLIGLHSITVTGEGTAQFVHGVTGPEKGK